MQTLGYLQLFLVQRYTNVTDNKYKFAQLQIITNQDSS